MLIKTQDPPCPEVGTFQGRGTIKKQTRVSSLLAQWVKDPVLSLLWLRSLLWYRFDPWSENFYMRWACLHPPKNFLVSL